MGYAAYYKNDIVNKKAFLSMIIVGRKFQGSGFGQNYLIMLFMIPEKAACKYYL